MSIVTKYGTLETNFEIIPCDHAKVEIRDAREATHLEDGYTGDTYCTVCGELLEKGTAIPAEGHSESFIDNNDGTHSAICTICGTVLSTESCYDNDSDGKCDVCGAILRKTETFRKVNAFTSGRSYLILSGNNALKSDLTSEFLQMVETAGVFVPSKLTDDSLLWIFDAGKLYCLADNTAYYLALDANNRLIVTTDKAKAAQWNVTADSLATTVTQKPGKKAKTTMYYLTADESGFALNTAKAPISLYEQIGDEAERTYELRKVPTIDPGKPAVIMVNGLALQNNLAPVSIEMRQSGAVYTTNTEINTTLLWYFEAGKLYSKTEAGNVYLTINASNTLIITQIKADAVNWTVENGSAFTDVTKHTGKKDRVTTYYLYCNDSAFTVNTSGSSISFYQQQTSAPR